MMELDLKYITDEGLQFLKGRINHEIELRDIGKVDVWDLDLSCRLRNCFMDNGITDLNQLKKHTKYQLRKWHRYGKKSENELIDLMEKHDISFMK